MAFCDCNAALQRGLTSPEAIATDLYSAKILTSEQRDEIQNSAIVWDSRTRKLLQYLDAQISSNPGVFHKFVGILKEEPAFSALVKQLVAALIARTRK